VTTILLKLIGQVNDTDGFEGTFLNADTTTTTKHFGDQGFVAFDTYSLHSAAHHRAVAHAEVIALFDFAFVNI
jgi:hypothetical protein